MTKYKILIIDDEPNVLKAFKRLFRKERETISVFTTESPDEVFELVTTEEFAVVVSDQRMPTMQGTEVLEKVRELSPETIRITLTGYADKEAAIGAINQGAVYRFLTKPWNDEELKQEIQNGIAQYSLVSENKRLNKLTQDQNEELLDLNRNLEQKVEERTEKISTLNKDLKEGFFGTIRLLSQISEMYSATSGSHSKRVANMSADIAKKLNLPSHEHFHVNAAAMLHDIGKISLPKHISDRPVATFNKSELELLRGHAEAGALIVETINQLKETATLIRYHHERFDGKGYPSGRAGEDIPLGSRIIAVANAYDHALYKPSSSEEMTPHKAFLEVKKRESSEFDPKLVDVLEAIVYSMDIDCSTEVELRPSELEPGMKITRNICLPNGTLLLPKQSVLDEKHIKNIQAIMGTSPVGNGVFIEHIYRRGRDEVAKDQTLVAADFASF